MKEEKKEARKKVREILEEYQKRTKNDPPKKIEGLDIKNCGSYAKFGPPVGAFANPRTKEIDRENMYKKIEKSAGDDIIYGIDEICSIYGLYGKNSEIYNAMAEGKAVSELIKESLQEHQQAGEIEIAKREESLLARCLRREQEKGLSV